MGVIIFNNIPSTDYGIQVELLPNYDSPEREYEVIRVPGRSGDVVIDKKSYKNISRKYYVAIVSKDKSFAMMANTLVMWLHSGVGYLRLEDSYEPEYFRHALYKESATVTNVWERAGRLELTFDCKPQRFLKTGEEITEITDTQSRIINPTSFNSKPLLKVYGNGPGHIYFGTAYEIEITNINGFITIDCELEDARRNLVNANNDIIISGSIGGFPQLIPGYSDITIDGGVTKIEVIPRWWTI